MARVAFESPTRLAITLAIGLLGAIAVAGVVQGIQGHRQLNLQPWYWLALAVTGAAVFVSLWDRAARLPLASLYGFALIAIGWGWIARNNSPGRMFLWGISCDLAGFALVTALAGWSLPRLRRLVSIWRIPDQPSRWSRRWFDRAQLLLIAMTAALSAWISLDFSFDGTGQDVALFGLSGRATGCMAALMLVGASIVMAWQSTGRWRAVWQYAAMATGIVFTTSVGWARLDAVLYPASGTAAWHDRAESLMISAVMMTLLTRIGLPRVVPSGSDWIDRGRRATPFFGGLAVLMFLAVLVL
ncbi:MAG: hypothetical protein JJ992_15345 [Planctomycetes bacterium]|nr:hypothetical protein [Planctomycetota bacterium]